MARRYELGQNYWLITGKPAKNALLSSWSGAPNLVLQAHGGGQKPWFLLHANIKVRFYTDHGEGLLVDTKHSNGGYNYYDTINHVFSETAKALDKYKGPCTCPNYYLSKFNVSKRSANKLRVSYDDLEAYVDRWQNLPYDIVTVRDRHQPGIQDPDLLELVTDLSRTAHAYTKLHILICRSNTEGGPSRATPTRV
jgi:hypothetical protein